MKIPEMQKEGILDKNLDPIPGGVDAFKKRRCLIPTDGFYEWKPGKPRKQPYFIHRKDGAPFALAGLWEHWEQDDLKIDSCTIIVTQANNLIAPIHDRMPVILAPADFDRWLDPDHRYFKILGDDNGIYIIRHNMESWVWELIFYQGESTGVGQ